MTVIGVSHRAPVRRSPANTGLRVLFGVGQPANRKIVPVLLVTCMLLPALAQVGIMATQGIGALSFTGYPFLMQVIVAAFVIARAPGLVRSGVIGLPALSALIGAVALILVAPLIIMFAGEALVGSPDVRDLVKGVAGAGLYAAVIGAPALVAAQFARRRAMAVLAFLMLAMTTAHVLYGVLQSLGWADEAAWALLLSPFNLVDAVLQWVFGTPPIEGISYPAGAGPIAVLIAFGVVAASVVSLGRRA